MHVFSFVPSWHRRYEHWDRLEAEKLLSIISFCSIYTWYICGYSTFQHPGTVHRDNKPCDCSSETSSWEWQAPLALHLGVLLAVLPTTSPRQCSIESCSIHVALNIFHLSDCHRILLEKNMLGPPVVTADLRQVFWPVAPRDPMSWSSLAAKEPAENRCSRGSWASSVGGSCWIFFWKSVGESCWD